MPFHMTKNNFYTLTTATTLASTSDSFYVDAESPVTVGIEPDLAAGETVDVQVTVDGTTYKDYVDSDATVQLTTGQNTLRLYGPAIYKVQKTATATSTCAVYLRK